MATQMGGCVSVSDVTESNDYFRFVGEKKLVVEAFLCTNPSGVRGVPESQLYRNYGFEVCPLGEHVASFPTGTNVDVNRVIVVTSGGLKTSSRWLIIGEVAEERFYFSYGHGYLEEGKPWEPKPLIWSN